MIKNSQRKKQRKQAAIEASLAMASGPVMVDLAGINNALGGFEARVRIQRGVDQRLLHSPELQLHWDQVKACGELPAYNMATFGFNVECIERDAAAGLIKEPESEEEWIDALTTEYQANVKAASKAMLDTECGTWLAAVQQELGDNPSEAATQTMSLIRGMRAEAAGGKWQTVYGEVIMPNADLCRLVFLAIAENHLAHLADAEGREKDAVRHLEAYTKATQDIYSDRFTDEEQGLAWMVLD